jgi:EmrB/QacA subfamily drug resistance transporter
MVPGVVFRDMAREAPPLPRLVAARSYPWLVVGTVCVGAFLGQLDASIAGLLLPTLETTFRAPVADVEWVAIAYLLVLAALVVPLGRMADLFGRKLLYTAGFLVFILGSALCGLAPALPWLIAFRCVQAVGAAMLQANSVAIITAAIDRRRLGRAIGVQGAAQAVGLSIGPSVGGLLIDALGWRWVFFIAVPFGLLGVVLGWLVLPRSTDLATRTARGIRERFDWAGALLLGPIVGLVLVGLTFGNTWGWTSPRMVLLGTATVAGLGAFIASEFRATSPLLDLALFCERQFSTGIAAGLAAYAVLFGCLFLVPFYLERILGYSATDAGVLLTPIPVALAIFAPVAGTLADRVGARPPTVAGMALSAVALVALAASPVPSLAFTLPILALLGIGLGLFTPPNNSSVMRAAPANRLGTAGGVLNMTRSVGTSLGVALTGAVLALLLSEEAGQQVVSTIDATPAQLYMALRGAFLFLAVLAAVAGGLSLIRGRSDVVVQTEQVGRVVFGLDLG